LLRACRDDCRSAAKGTGDANPYGVAVVCRSRGRLHHGDVPVSNFSEANLQGMRVYYVDDAVNALRVLR
jgi:hypothetical protein